MTRSFTSDNANRVVVTAQGALAGFTEGGVHAFLGVPYAEPPVGALRWRAPQPPQDWTGVRSATAFGPAAPQAVATGIDLGVPDESEDCLYLNVWTEQLEPEARRPVMVWIHGGGNLYGAASIPMWDPSSLARRGVTVVSFNYRLGVFGFLAQPSVGANFAVQDYVAALSWVNQNIARFGGDPDNVTVFGQSAGAVAVRTLLACPAAAGLFHRGIIQSAGFEAAATGEWWSLDRNEKAAEELFATLGMRDPDALRLRPTQEVLEASRALSGAKDRPGYIRTPAELVWMPVVDEETVVSDGYPGWESNVPLMLGTVENESRFFLAPSRNYDRPLLERMTAALAGQAAPDCLRWFDEAGLGAYEALDALVTTAIFTEPAAETLKHFAALGRDIRYYHFTRCSPGARASGLLAAHASELRYVFGTLTEGGEYDAVDRQLSDSLQQAWVSFARTGSVQGGMRGEWPAFKSGSPKVTILGDTVHAEAFALTPLARILVAARREGPKRNWLGYA